MRVLAASLLVVSGVGCATSTVHGLAGVGQFGDRVLVRRSTTTLNSSWTGSSFSETDDYALCRLIEGNQVQCEKATVSLPPETPAAPR
jgi:hypothetical protein